MVTIVSTLSKNENSVKHVKLDLEKHGRHKSKCLFVFFCVEECCHIVFMFWHIFVDADVVLTCVGSDVYISLGCPKRPVDQINPSNTSPQASL